MLVFLLASEHDRIAFSFYFDPYITLLDSLGRPICYHDNPINDNVQLVMFDAIPLAKLHFYGSLISQWL
jgi:hypothetical protein